MLKRGVLPQGTPMTAEEAAKDLKTNLFTCVLATVYCPGWSLNWSMSLAAMISNCYCTCSLLQMVAVQGGPACDEEVAFIDVMLRMLGFTEKEVKEDDMGYICWSWNIKRPGAQRFEVELVKRTTIHDISCTDFRFDQSNDRVPNLARVAVVSCAENWAPQKAETVWIPEKLPQRIVFDTSKEGVFLICNREDDHDSPCLGFRTSADLNNNHPDLAVRWGTEIQGEKVQVDGNGWLKVELKEKKSMRLNEEDKTVNDMLNKNLLEELEKVQKILAWKQRYPEKYSTLQQWCTEYMVHKRQK